MDQLWEILFLAVLQGLTEFLPVSSSGHLVLAMAVMEKLGWQLGAPVTVNVALHVGTLGAVLAYFRRDLWRIAVDDWRTAAMVGVASVPAGVAGVLIRKWAAESLENPWVATAGLIVTGILLLAGTRLASGTKDHRALSVWDALFVGCFQAAAVLPGISRSGSTIVGGLLCGLAPREAALFSFLMAVPVMVGAGILEVHEVLNEPQPPANLVELGLGAGCAALVGWVAIAWLLQWVKTGRLKIFAFWVFAVAALSLAWLLFAR